jgi:hypothetical protein
LGRLAKKKDPWVLIGKTGRIFAQPGFIGFGRLNSPFGTVWNFCLKHNHTLDQDLLALVTPFEKGPVGGFHDRKGGHI